MLQQRLALPGHVAPEEDVVVHLPEELGPVVVVASQRSRPGSDDRVPGVPDELSLGHLVLDVR